MQINVDQELEKHRSILNAFFPDLPQTVSTKILHDAGSRLASIGSHLSITDASHQRRMDGRDVSRFYMDVTLGWTLEDAFIFAVTQIEGVQASSEGCDKERILVIDSSSVKANPDVTITNGKRTSHIELQVADRVAKNDRGLPMVNVREDKWFAMTSKKAALLTFIVPMQKVLMITPAYYDLALEVRPGTTPRFWGGKGRREFDLLKCEKSGCLKSLNEILDTIRSKAAS